MQIPGKLSIRLGNLREAVEAKIAKTNETPSEYVRRLIAEDCGVDVPEMTGHYQNLKPFANRKKP